MQSVISGAGFLFQKLVVVSLCNSLASVHPLFILLLRGDSYFSSLFHFLRCRRSLSLSLFPSFFFPFVRQLMHIDTRRSNHEFKYIPEKESENRWWRPHPDFFRLIFTLSSSTYSDADLCYFLKRILYITDTSPGKKVSNHLSVVFTVRSLRCSSHFETVDFILISRFVVARIHIIHARMSLSYKAQRTHTLLQ